MGGKDIYPLDVYAILSEVMPEMLPEFWVSNGFRFEPSEDDAERYYRYKGTSQVQSNYQQYTTENLPNNLITAREMAERVEESTGVNINSYFVRLFWSPEGDQPGRADYREDKSQWSRDRSTYSKLLESARRRRGF